MSAVSRALNRIQHDGRFTMQEMAEVAGCSPRHLYNCASPKHSAELRADQLAALSQYLSKHGEVRLAEALLHPRWSVHERIGGTANGQTEDDMARIVRAAVGADEAFQARDCDLMQDHIRALRRAAADLEQEHQAICT